MNSSNPLDPIFKAFEVANDCFKVARRTIESQSEDLMRRTQFAGSCAEKAHLSIASARDQAADLAILALWVTFERYLIEHLQAGKRLLAAGFPAQYSINLAEKFESEIEYWRIDDILDLLKGEIDPDLIGRAKQIKKYRDWIAHRNTRRAVSTRTEPETAFEVLTVLLKKNPCDSYASR
jgi:hypothetical protein